MGRKPYVPVSQVMTAHPMIIDGLATVREAVRTMRDHHVRSLVINKRFESDEYGLVVISDVAAKVAATDRPADRVSVYEIMTKPVLTVPADMDIRYALRMLCHFEVSRALVLDKGELVGIVTLRDLTFRYLLPSTPGQNHGAPQHQETRSGSLATPPLPTEE